MGGRNDMPAAAQGLAASTHFVSASSLRQRLDWLNRLRWGAALGVAAGTLVAGPGLGLELPVSGLLGAAGVLALLNLVYVLRNRTWPAGDIARELRYVKLQMVIDLVLLTVMLNLSGGHENPFFFIYIVHVILASLLFRGRDIYRIALLSGVLFSALMLGEYAEVLPHRHVAGAGELGHSLPFVLAGLGAFWLVMMTCAHIGATIMSHNRSIKDDLVQRQAALVDADRERMEFFRFVTHEVKSPVGTAQSAVQTVLELDGEKIGETARGLLERARDRLVQATVIVQDLADLTRGGGGLAATDLEAVDLNGAVSAVISRHRDLAAANGQELDWRPAPGGPALLWADADMVDKVVANLVVNALHYGGEGRVTVTTEVGVDAVTLTVADRGIGIPPDDLGRIFDEFYRTQRAREISRHGTGLGLAIVKRFIGRMGGQVDVESQVGVGSTFKVTWPRHRQEVG